MMLKIAKSFATTDKKNFEWNMSEEITNLT